MSTINIELDERLLALLHQQNQPVHEKIREFIVLGMYQQHTISSGKAAELLGMELWDFIQYSGRLGIPLVDMADEEWEIERQRSRMI